MEKKFTQEQARAMFNCLRDLEIWLQRHADLVGTECEESDKLKDIQRTLNKEP